MILVGDSLGNVTLGYDSTYPVTMEDMLIHCKAVRRGAPNTFVVGDMPFMSYQVSDEEAVANAGRFCKEARADCVKMGGRYRCLPQLHPCHHRSGHTASSEYFVIFVLCFL